MVFAIADPKVKSFEIWCMEIRAPGILSPFVSDT